MQAAPRHRDKRSLSAAIGGGRSVHIQQQPNKSVVSRLEQCRFLVSCKAEQFSRHTGGPLRWPPRSRLHTIGVKLPSSAWLPYPMADVGRFLVLPPATSRNARLRSVLVTPHPAIHSSPGEFETAIRTARTGQLSDGLSLPPSGELGSHCDVCGVTFWDPYVPQRQGSGTTRLGGNNTQDPRRHG